MERNDSNGGAGGLDRSPGNSLMNSTSHSSPHHNNPTNSGIVDNLNQVRKSDAVNFFRFLSSIFVRVEKDVNTRDKKLQRESVPQTKILERFR